MHYGLVLWRGVLRRWTRGRIVGRSLEVMLQRQQTQEGGTWCCCRVGTEDTPGGASSEQGRDKNQLNSAVMGSRLTGLDPSHSRTPVKLQWGADQPA